MFPTLNKWLAGKPDTVVRLILILLSSMGMIVAFIGTPTMRLFVTAWFLFP